MLGYFTTANALAQVIGPDVPLKITNEDELIESECVKMVGRPDYMTKYIFDVFWKTMFPVTTGKYGTVIMRAPTDKWTGYGSSMHFLYKRVQPGDETKAGQITGIGRLKERPERDKNDSSTKRREDLRLMTFFENNHYDDLAMTYILADNDRFNQFLKI